jgi:hypothetical protein
MKQISVFKVGMRRLRSGSVGGIESLSPTLPPFFFSFFFFLPLSSFQEEVTDK